MAGYRIITAWIPLSAERSNKITNRITPNSKIRDRMYKKQENLENTGLQLPVDKVQGPVGGFVKSVFANLKPSKPGGDVNDNC